MVFFWVPHLFIEVGRRLGSDDEIHTVLSHESGPGSFTLRTASRTMPQKRVVAMDTAGGSALKGEPPLVAATYPSRRWLWRWWVLQRLTVAVKATRHRELFF